MSFFKRKSSFFSRGGGSSATNSTDRPPMTTASSTERMGLMRGDKGRQGGRSYANTRQLSVIRSSFEGSKSQIAATLEDDADETNALPAGRKSVAASVAAFESRAPLVSLARLESFRGEFEFTDVDSYGRGIMARTITMGDESSQRGTDCIEGGQAGSGGGGGGGASDEFVLKPIALNPMIPFGLVLTENLRVTEVKSGSQAAAAGVKAGSLLVGVDNVGAEARGGGGQHAPEVSQEKRQPKLEPHPGAPIFFSSAPSSSAARMSSDCGSSSEARWESSSAPRTPAQATEVHSLQEFLEVVTRIKKNESVAATESSIFLIFRETVSAGDEASDVFQSASPFVRHGSAASGRGTHGKNSDDDDDDDDDDEGGGASTEAREVRLSDFGNALDLHAMPAAEPEQSGTRHDEDNKDDKDAAERTPTRVGLRKAVSLNTDFETSRGAGQEIEQSSLSLQAQRHSCASCAPSVTSLYKSGNLHNLLSQTARRKEELASDEAKAKWKGLQVLLKSQPFQNLRENMDTITSSVRTSSSPQLSSSPSSLSRAHMLRSRSSDADGASDAPRGRCVTFCDEPTVVAVVESGGADRSGAHEEGATGSAGSEGEAPESRSPETDAGGATGGDAKQPAALNFIDSLARDKEQQERQSAEVLSILKGSRKQQALKQQQQGYALSRAYGNASDAYAQRGHASDAGDGTGVSNKVKFRDVTVRFFDYAVGGSVPNITKGAPIGLGGDWRRHGEVIMTVEDIEELRGGNFDMKDKDDAEEEEEEEWDDNWRVPREYFADEGLIAKDRRAELLLATGDYRRLSIDLLAAQTGWAIASRKAGSVSTVAQMIVLGFDIDEIYNLDLEIMAAQKLAFWMKKILDRRR